MTLCAVYPGHESKSGVRTSSEGTAFTPATTASKNERVWMVCIIVRSGQLPQLLSLVAAFSVLVVGPACRFNYDFTPRYFAEVTVG